MKKLLVLLSLFVFSSLLVATNTLAANPDKIKVGILLPLTGTFAAVAETQRDGALLAIDVVNKRGGLSMPWEKSRSKGSSPTTRPNRMSACDASATWSPRE